jgi:hypothetical protein
MGKSNRLVLKIYNSQLHQRNSGSNNHCWIQTQKSLLNIQFFLRALRAFLAASVLKISAIHYTPNLKNLRSYFL